MTRLDDLTAVALKMHEGQVDKQGRPYSEHILAVTDAVSDEAKPVALFHDAMEDWTEQSVTLARELSDDEFAAVAYLTHEPWESYADYIATIAAAPGVRGRLAREVKVADLRHNLGRLTPDLESLRPRYENALRTLGAESCTASTGDGDLVVRQTPGKHVHA